LGLRRQPSNRLVAFFCFGLRCVRTYYLRKKKHPMAFKKGRNKTGGRQKGGTNKVTLLTREAVQSILSDNAGEFQHRLSRLDDEAFCRTYISLLPYVLPRQKELKATLNAGGGFVAILPDNGR